MLVLSDDRAAGRVFNVGGGRAVTTREFADIVMRQYGSGQPGMVTGEYRFGDTRHILSDISALRALGWEPRRTPADSVAAYAEWLKGMDGLDGVLAEADARMRALGVVRKARSMKAFLLAAGVGSRLRPITDTIPKCMVPIDGQPMLDIWLDAFDRAGVDEVLVNLHHLPDVVRHHLEARAGTPAVRTFFEPELLGSAGTLAANRAWVDGEEMFLACYADNLTDFDLRSLVQAHREHGAIATLTVFHSERPSAGGVVELDAAGTVVGFEEKPSQPGIRSGERRDVRLPSRACSTRSAARRRVTSAMTCCRGWWAGPGPCRWRATSGTSERSTRTSGPSGSGQCEPPI